MRNYGIYVVKRFGLFVLVVFVGISLTFLITHLTPIDPVEQMIASMTAFGDTSPEAVEMMRAALRELYGVEGNLFEQYLNYWRRMLVLDFGPSLSAFPTPVSVLIGRALPWTIGLLVSCTLISWTLGNLLGGLSGYYRDNRALGALGVVAMAFHPVPYYIIAFILLLLFGFLWPILPISGGAGQNVAPGLTFEYLSGVFRHAILPALSIILVGVGGWFLGMRALVSNIVTEDYVAYAELAGVSRRRILVSYVMRNALVPQVTGLAMSLGGIFTGAIIVEQVFGYPGLGRLLVGAVYSADYSLVLGVTAISIIAVAGAVFLIDILYPLFDPRMQLS
ncbi:MAG: ABC transporter permease [Devosia sp.]|uniref:ABC transporter permease n=1 Tax=unclassified Devosia TaxID=196773 RepID=UPI0019E812F8|nr:MULTISPECIES: ABC transporter permease [unclassified Devosia]MBF0677804.1 ABC transporter permease [Devosia sp.]WEJ34144.1 ABC transporter permease [Devosia sp. SD17-2]